MASHAQFISCIIKSQSSIPTFNLTKKSYYDIYFKLYCTCTVHVNYVVMYKNVRQISTEYSVFAERNYTASTATLDMIELYWNNIDTEEANCLLCKLWNIFKGTNSRIFSKMRKNGLDFRCTWSRSDYIPQKRKWWPYFFKIRLMWNVGESHKWFM